ncbi:lytic transglycosylase, catalytic [Candidatus Vecturithrix granuli]|uniref:Lytic transglycosylase, catalytic n=1 Tax=Vecturithrix granuli TaxID=1499967 RepID=A0A081C5W1_VECG1|nr:lytic transglycosylase, catalytic [Candidatus Vecturithrix granuli]
MLMKKQILIISVFIVLQMLIVPQTFAQESFETRSLDQLRQTFMSAYQLFDTKQYESAALMFAQLDGHYPQLQDYVQYFLAESYRNGKRPEEALQELQQFLKTYPDHPLAHEVRFNVANLLVKLKQTTDAISIYQNLLSDSDLNRGELYYQLGLAFIETNNVEHAVSALAQATFFSPKHTFLQDAKKQLEQLLNRHPEFSLVWTEDLLLNSAKALLDAKAYSLAIQQYELYRKRYSQSLRLGENEINLAEAYFQAGKSAQARELLGQLASRYAASQPELTAQALYTLGVKDWQADRNQEAKHYMQQIITAWRQTSWADDAYYVIGRIFQSQKAYPVAAQWYVALQKRYPASSFAEEALWRAGWSHYLAGQYIQAARMFSRAISTFPSGSFTQECFYWQGRSFEQQQNSRAAIKCYQQLLSSAPESYYAIRAQDRLRLLNTPVALERRLSGTSPKFPELVAKAQQIFTPEQTQMLLRSMHKAFELESVQLQTYARKEIAWLENQLQKQDLSESDSEQNLLRVYFLGRVYAQFGDYLKGIQLAATIESLLADSSTPFPYALEYLQYPLAYWDLITRYAAQNTLDPFFVAGIIRQESAYNPRALSYANAMGLMQVIPSTAARVAKRLGLKQFTTAQLYEPETNIAIGTAYIAEMLEKFEGNLFRAIAAYNAGPNATNKWWPQNIGIDDEEVVENITYNATRNYVKRVLRDQHRYRSLYSVSEK